MAKFLALENVEQAARQYPDSFFIPPESERKSQKVGASVKLHFLLENPPDGAPRAERMWVTITQKEGFLKSYKGTLENVPAFIEDLQPGDEITFKSCHIAQTVIKKGDPRWIDSADQKALVSKRCFEKGQIVRFLYRQEADRDEDSGWRMFAGSETPEYTDDAANIRLVDVGYMLDLDPSLLAPLKEGIGAVFERKGKGTPWQRVTDWSPDESDIY